MIVPIAENKDKSGVFKPRPLFFAVFSGFITLCFIFIILALLIRNMVLPEEYISLWAYAACALSSFVCATLYLSASSTCKLTFALVPGGLFYLLLVILGLFLSGTRFSAGRMLTVAATVIISCLLSAAVRNGTRGGRRSR